MRVLRQEYGLDKTGNTLVARLEVEANGKIFCAQEFLPHYVFLGSTHPNIPYKVVMRGLQARILDEIGKELFG